MKTTCPICKDACSEITPFFVVCSTRDNPPNRICINAECCDPCISKIRRKENVLPHFIGPGSTLLAFSLFCGWKFLPQALVHMPTAILILSAAAIGLILLTVGGIISLRIGTTDVRLLSMKQFVAQCTKERLGTFTPVIKIQSASPNGVPMILFSSNPEHELRNSA